MISSPPPLLPAADRSLQRALQVARIDGWGVAGFSALCGLAALVQAQWTALGWCALAGGCGLLELHGRRRLRQSRPVGTVWLVNSQCLLLAVIWAYLWSRWQHFDPDAFWAQMPELARVKLNNDMRAAGLDPDYDRPALLLLMNQLVCVVAAAVSLLYQGGLGIYYAVKARLPAA
ncbi:MAG: hypothetical protein JNG83_04130 [Opitutaceae bacterium]|nr:hypothetical protein [Opitutaceae bacterium]